MSTDTETKAIAEAKKKSGNESFAKKDYDEALRLYSEAIDLDPLNYIYHSNRSACYAAKGDHAKAREAAQECIRLNADFTKGYYRLASAQADMGDIEAALATVEAGLGKDPKSGDLLRQKRALRLKRAASNSVAKRNQNARGSVGEGRRLDDQTIKEFQELSEKVSKTKRDLAEVEAQLQVCVREEKRGALTRGELDRLEDEARMYQSIGKMFMLRDKDDIEKLLDDQREGNVKAVEQLKAKQSYLENELKSGQGDLDEIIKNIRAQA